MTGPPAHGRIALRLGLAAGSLLFAVLAAALLLSWVVNHRFESRLLGAVSRQDVSENTFNIYYFGESTMAGEPYAPEASIPQLVEHMLDRRVAGQAVRSVNLAQPGSDLQYSLDRLEEVVRHRRTTRPSLCVFYVGHNEFLKYAGRVPHALFALPPVYTGLLQRADALFPPLDIDDRRLLDVGVVSLAERREIVGRYASRLRQAVAMLQRQGIPAIVSTVAGNYADWEPNRSIFTGEPRRASEVERSIEQGSDLERRGDVPAAVSAYRAALVHAPEVAEVHYRLAGAYRRMGDNAAAWPEFEQAVDLDAMPMRATTGMNESIRHLAGPLLTTVDAVRQLREHAAGGLIGADLMIDGHHPNLAGYILISRLFAEAIRSRFAPADGALRTLDEATAREIFGIDRRKRFDVAISRGRWFSKLATWRYDPAQRLQRAEEFFREAHDLDSARAEPYLGLAMVQFLRGDAAGGELQAAQARTRAPQEADDYFRESWVYRVRQRAHRMASGRAFVARGR